MSLLNNAGLIAQLSGDLSIFDNFDLDKVANLFKTLTFTNEIYRGQPDIRRLRQQRAEAQQQQRQMALQQEIMLNQSKKGGKND
jgi:hypothetical protein